MTYEIALPRTFRIGSGALSELGSVLDGLGLARPLIVTDRFMVETGAVDKLLAALSGHGIISEIFSDTVPDPTSESLDPGVYLAARHNADCVVGFGGGSPMDTAKAVALLAVQGGAMRNYKAPRDNSGSALPLIAVPTTAGSGSETTKFTVITDSETREKMLCPGLAFLPVAAIVDYELTLSMPPRLTADTGVDALTHAVEAYVSRRANPFSDGIALTAIKTIGQYLRRAYLDGGDVEARENMMLASTQAGIAFSNSSVALVHGMSRPLGVHFHVAHGLSNAMLFPAVTAFSVTQSPSRYAECARAFGVASAADPDARAASRFVESLVELNNDLAVPTPHSFGIKQDQWLATIPAMVEQALASGSPQNNPAIPDREQIAHIYQQIFI